MNNSIEWQYENEAGLVKFKRIAIKKRKGIRPPSSTTAPLTQKF